MIDIRYMLEIAKTAALEAGKAILEVYASGDFGVEMKSDQSPLTLADKAAHEIIMKHLEQTGIPVVSEEGSSVSFEERKNWEYCWLVDPLDGTKEFIKKTGEFTVNIALVHAGVPVAGIIYAPILDTLYYGSAETGVYKMKKDIVETLSSIEKKQTISELQSKTKLTIVASKSHMNDETTAFINQFDNVNLLSIGSSLKLMLLAEGAADIYPRLAPTMEWDIAAGHALLSSLNFGVYQTDLSSELVYNKKDLLNPPFIAL